MKIMFFQLRVQKKVSVFGKNSVDLVYGVQDQAIKLARWERIFMLALKMLVLRKSSFKIFYNSKSQSGSGRPNNPCDGSFIKWF